MENVQQEILAALLLVLREKDLINQDVYARAKETVFQKTGWPDWFCTSGI